MGVISQKASIAQTQLKRLIHIFTERHSKGPAGDCAKNRGGTNAVRMFVCRPKENSMKPGALLQRVFYPRIDTPELAEQAVQNGGVAGWIMVAVHFLLGAFLIIVISGQQTRISGDELWPGVIQLFLALLYGALATYSWRGSRGAIVGMVSLLVLDTLVVLIRIKGFDPQVAVHLAAIILAIGGMRGAFARDAFEKADNA